MRVLVALIPVLLMVVGVTGFAIGYAGYVLGVVVRLADYDFTGNATVLDLVVYRSNPCISVFVSNNALLENMTYHILVHVARRGGICVQVIPAPLYVTVVGPLPPYPGTYKVVADIYSDYTSYEVEIGKITYYNTTPPVIMPSLPQPIRFSVYTGFLAELVSHTSNGWFVYRDNYGRLVALPILVVPEAALQKPYYIAYGRVIGNVLYAYHYVITNRVYRIIEPVVNASWWN